MNCVILAAGYATRLYPLTRNFPKPLLEVGEKTILDRLMDKLAPLSFDQVCVVTNHKYASHFEAWRPDHVSLVNNGTTQVEDRLGASADLQLGLDMVGDDQPCLVTAADNLFPFDLLPLWHAYDGTSLITVWENPDMEDQTRRGNVVLQAERVTEFVEKPNRAVTNLAAAPLYVFSPADLAKLPHYLGEVALLPIEQRDAPGHFVSWLIERETVGAHRLNAKPVDIGTPEALERARSRYA